MLPFQVSCTVSMTDYGVEGNDSWIRMLYIFCASANYLYLNAHGGMTSITLSFSDMLIVVRGGDFLYHCWSERNRSHLASGVDVEVLPLYVHVTSDVLPQKLPMCLNFRSSTTYSSTSHPRTSLTSSGFFIVNIHFGFVWDTSLFWIFCDHTYSHTQGCMIWIPGVITHPAPNWHASVYWK